MRGTPPDWHQGPEPHLFGIVAPTCRVGSIWPPGSPRQWWRLGRRCVKLRRPPPECPVRRECLYDLRWCVFRVGRFPGCPGHENASTGFLRRSGRCCTFATFAAPWVARGAEAQPWRLLVRLALRIVRLLLLRSSRRIRQAFILRREIRAAVANVAEPVGTAAALGVASFRAGWRDELAASDWFFILPAVDVAAYGRGRERAKVFREAVRAEGKRPADWSGFSSLSAVR